MKKNIKKLLSYVKLASFCFVLGASVSFCSDRPIKKDAMLKFNIAEKLNTTQSF